MTSPRRKILAIASSGRNNSSISRQLGETAIAGIQESLGVTDVTCRDVNHGIPFINENWINANFTAAEDRSPEQMEALALSDRLVAEVKAADLLIISLPIYNFSIPAALKAWIDLVARVQLTFRYTQNGPEGLLKDKKTLLLVASGGTAIDSPADFAIPYLRHALAFIGITDVTVIAAEQINAKGESTIEKAHSTLNEVIESLSWTDTADVA